ncbi:hypothetical protein NXV42_00495 [Bacteroides fragilis]|nr:hypothetical protein [Bacteroides fragilis]
MKLSLFIWGAPDLSNYFSEAAYEEIDMSSVDLTAQKINLYIKGNYYQNKLSVILEEKKKVLNEFNIFAKMNDIILENVTVSCKDAGYILNPEQVDLLCKVRQKIYRIFF